MELQQPNAPEKFVERRQNFCAGAIEGSKVEAESWKEKELRNFQLLKELEASGQEGKTKYYGREIWI